MDNYDTLKKRIQQQRLIPNPKIVGEFIQRKKDKESKLKFLSPNNWVFHQQIVDCVLKSEYNKIRPYSAEFVTTLNCSNRCEIPCGYEDVKRVECVWEKNNFQDSEVHMQDLGFAKNLLDKLVEGGIKGLIFTGGGEPTLFNNLEDLIAYATEKKVDSVLYTNGNAISEKRLQKIVEASPLLIRTSLNAGTEKVYNKFHQPLNPKEALEKCLNTIEFLARASLKNPNLTTGIGIVINEINQDNLIETAYRIMEIVDKTGGGINSVSYRPAFNYYCSKQLSPQLLNKTHEIVETKVKPILKKAGVKVSNVTCRYDALKQDTRTYDKCRTTGLYAELGPNGNLHHCCDRNLNRRFIIGNLTKNSLKEIYNSEQRANQITYINSNKCKVCPPACKSHETNKQFQQIEDLRQQGKINQVRLWIEEQQKAPKPKMVNF